MEVTLEKVYPVSTPAAAAWRVLSDIRSVAQCMPGAEITEQIDANRYKGQVKVRIGPATAAFDGEIEVLALDPAQMAMSLRGKGSDVKGASAAIMDLSAYIRPVSAGACELVGTSTISVTGKLANFGGRMMTQVSDQILKQFADNFRMRALAAGEDAAAQEASTKVVAQPRELNALGIFFRVLWNFMKGLFRRSTAKSQ
ncbi:SRPBCC family protein [Pelomicrobium methylotrophicum]|uniref:Carbon monoxide dehydrogenase n=1 Tax=Pelomicrobium methylotrophicum TaxID=2602750 RepID=A0A5C7EJA0_9PROT|nr:SRPBCC family protein [Pelomicrobium methylotrophicum]TXF11405.1 carbon monoxide dehydrogenase [Pelomicrobium methylotrophicum]